jgi:hypothetical protein
MISKKIHHNVLSPKGMQLPGGLFFLLLSLFWGLFDFFVVLVAALITLKKSLFSNPYLLWDWEPWHTLTHGPCLWDMHSMLATNPLCDFCVSFDVKHPFLLLLLLLSVEQASQQEFWIVLLRHY